MIQRSRGDDRQLQFRIGQKFREVRIASAAEFRLRGFDARRIEIAQRRQFIAIPVLGKELAMLDPDPADSANAKFDFLRHFCILFDGFENHVVLCRPHVLLPLGWFCRNRIS